MHSSIFTLCSSMDWELESNHTVAVFYTDFRKAFDSVSHCKLISRLEMIGITGLLFRVSEIFLTFCDVPLWPLLFLECIENIVQHTC